MTAFRKRDGIWQARIRRKGYPPIYKSFPTKKDTERWALSIEAVLDNGRYMDTSLAEKTTFREIFERYMSDVTPNMRSVKRGFDTLESNQTSFTF